MEVGQHSTMDSFLPSDPAALALNLGARVLRFLEHCLVGGQWHLNKPI